MNEVTILCITHGAREAVQLTLSSLRRHTPEPVRILVGDTGSRDGTLEYLRGCRDVELYEFPVGTQQGAALDRLVPLVRTRYLLTLDSDVEILVSNWLSALVHEAERRDLIALGELEPAIGNYQARLAPHLMLLRVAPIRELGLTFAGRVVVDDPQEAAWFRAQPGGSFALTRAEARALSTARFYSTGAYAFERIREAGEPWGETPLIIRARYRHYGHMSWAHAHPQFAGQHGRHLEEIRARLAGYGEVAHADA